MAPIHFGILMIEFQALDAIGPLDILSSCSKELVSKLEAGGFPGTAGMTEKAIDIKFYYINETMEPVKTSGGLRLLPSNTCDDCPSLDFLLVGGPNPFTFQLGERFAKFIRAHVDAGKGIFTTCSGAWAIAPSGVLDGKNATTNHGMVDFAMTTNPSVNWTKEKQWVIDGNIWTAGGALAGMDMMASWVMQNYGMEIARAAFKGLDFEPRDVNGNRVLPQQHGVAATA